MRLRVQCGLDAALHAAKISASDGGDCETMLASFAKAGIDIRALSQRLQEDGAASFVKSWTDLLACIRFKRTALQRAS